MTTSKTQIKPIRVTRFKWWTDSETAQILPDLRRYRSQGITWEKIAKDLGSTLKPSQLSRFFRANYGKVTAKELRIYPLYMLSIVSKPPANWNSIVKETRNMIHEGATPTEAAKFMRESGWGVTERKANQFITDLLKMHAELIWNEDAEILLEKRTPKKRSKRPKQRSADNHIIQLNTTRVNSSSTGQGSQATDFRNDSL